MWKGSGWVSVGPVEGTRSRRSVVNRLECPLFILAGIPRMEGTMARSSNSLFGVISNNSSLTPVTLLLPFFVTIIFFFCSRQHPKKTPLNQINPKKSRVAPSTLSNGSQTPRASGHPWPFGQTRSHEGGRSSNRHFGQPGASHRLCASPRRALYPLSAMRVPSLPLGPRQDS